MENHRSPNISATLENVGSPRKGAIELDDETAEAKVLEAADRLFYEHGIRTVGMDDIRDAAGVSLKRLYRIFPTKEQLAVATLRRRDQSFLTSLAAYTADLPTPRDKILGVFDFLYGWFGEPDYRGCPFINAFGEMSTVSGDVVRAIEDQKHTLEEFLADLVVAAGRPAILAEQLLILANGAMVTAAILHSPESARHARAAAQSLLDAA